MQLTGMKLRPLLRSRCAPGGPALRALRRARRAQRGMRPRGLLPANAARAARRGRALLPVRPSTGFCLATADWNLSEVAMQQAAQCLVCTESVDSELEISTFVDVKCTNLPLVAGVDRHGAGRPPCSPECCQRGT